MIFIFWCLCLLLILAAAMPLARALLRQNGTGAGTAEFDIAVYRDQLRDVERDLDRGVLAPEAAERTRLEISRRILAADKARAATDAPRPIPPLANGAALVLMAVLIAGGSLWSYAHLGAPGYGDQPLAQRRAAAEVLHATRPSQTEAEALAVRPPQPEADAGYRELVAQLREKLAERPDDPRGLQLLAQNEANLGNFNAAYAAQIRLLEILGDQAPAQGYAELTEFYVMAAGGYVSPEAETALRTALLRDPSNGPARYYLGLMQAQTGRPDLAFRTWRILLEQSAPDAPWMSAIRAQIQQAAAQAGVDYTLPPLPAAPARAGPSPEDIAAAEDLSAEDRQAMIEGMVEGLAARLASEGGPAPQWAQLIAALGVLGQNDRAAAIHDEAMQVFANDPEGLAAIAAAAQQAGVTQ